MKSKLHNFVYCLIACSFFLSIFCSCSSNEQKAKKLIDKDMFSCLIDYDSYETIETTVDSLKNQSFGDTLILDAILTYESFKRASVYNSNLKPLEDIWSDIRFAEYSNNEFNLLSDSEKEAACSFNYSSLWSTAASNILVITKQHSDSSFYGYIVTHRFRCKNREGIVSSNSYVYFVDKDFTRIIRKFSEECLSLDDYKAMINQALGDGEALSYKHKGERFLKENAKKEDVKVLPSGVQYKIIKQGSGKIPKGTETVLIHYDIKTIDGNLIFTNFDKEPIDAKIFSQIKGLSDALTHMPTGSIWEIYIPQELAFGEQSNIPGLEGLEPYSTLITKVELIRILD